MSVSPRGINQPGSTSRPDLPASSRAKAATTTAMGPAGLAANALPNSRWTVAVTLVVMLLGTAGVLNTIFAGRKVKCACLGAVFNLPMSYVTLAEDGLMAIMAAAMLLI